MGDKLREEIGLFRYGVISELVSSRLDPGELTELIRKKSEQRCHIPSTRRSRISTATITRRLRLNDTVPISQLVELEALMKKRWRLWCGCANRNQPCRLTD